MTAPAPFDPILPPMEAAEYLGFRGKNPTRSLRRLNLARSRMPGTGTSRYGYRLSVLNAYLEALNDPKSRIPLLRSVPPDTSTARDRRGHYAGRMTA